MYKNYLVSCNFVSFSLYCIPPPPHTHTHIISTSTAAVASVVTVNHLCPYPHSLKLIFFFIQYILMKKLISEAVLKQLMEEVCLMLCGSLFQTAGPCISCKVVKLKLKNVKHLTP